MVAKRHLLLFVSVQIAICIIYAGNGIAGLCAPTRYKTDCNRLPSGLALCVGHSTQAGVVTGRVVAPDPISLRRIALHLLPSGLVALYAGHSTKAAVVTGRVGVTDRMGLTRTALQVSRREVLGSAVLGDGFKLKRDEAQNVKVFERNSAGVVYVVNGVFTQMEADDQLKFGLNLTQTGTGWVFDTEGHIVTNYHVIKGAQAVAIRFIDGTIVPSTVLGADPGSDIAVLQLASAPLPSTPLMPLARGCSGTLKVGQEVFAVGFPFSLIYQTLTKGIISGLGRAIPSQADGVFIQGVIQTDAALNPGMSGGPLLNTDGNVIAMNTEILSPTGVSAGIGMAIPVDTVAARVSSIIKYGYVKRPTAGLVLGQDGVARMIAKKDGAIIAGFGQDSPAEKAGLQFADIIIEIDGARIKGTNDFYAEIDKHQAGDEVNISLLRPRGDSSNKTVLLKDFRVSLELKEADNRSSTL